MTGTATGVGATQAVLDVVTRLESEEPALAPQLRAIRERVEGPLRVAIAGRVKAGKSTLLNALVGERLAPTDAGECTRLVSWYRKGPSYEVRARLQDGTDQPLGFRRVEGALDIQLDGLREADVLSLDVSVPSSTLNQITLIDTPGLASLNDENSRRTRDFLDTDTVGGSDADAVIYLMRHVHKDDVAFLDAFMDRSVAAASPVNAVAVLSRADEIGAGRLDAMESATRIARRYESDPQVRSLCASVTPLAGLLAETGLTLREDEVANLRTLAATEPATLERMLLSSDELFELSASELTVELRRNLLDRLGMFGLRVALHELAAGATTAAALGPRLVELSGLGELRRIITEHFTPRARVLQARTALVALRNLAHSVQDTDKRTATAIDREAERIESNAVEFAQLRAAHLVGSGSVRVDDGERAELERLLLADGASTALGLGPSASPEDVRAAALSAIGRWRNRAGDPLADPALIEVCETAARSCEAIYASTG
jgi:triphosphoribosyl-dephospho-CoA synthetase